MARARTVQRSRAWISPHVGPDERERMLDHVEGLDTTRVSYAVPIVIGMVAGVVAAVGLLLASL